MKDSISENIKEMIEINAALMETKLVQAHGKGYLDKEGKPTTWLVTIKKIEHDFIECPQCHRKSYHPEDIKNKYCNACGYHSELKNG